MNSSDDSSLQGGSEGLAETILRPARRKSSKRKALKSINRGEKFSLHFGFGKSRFTLVLVQYNVSNKTIGGYDYDKPPTDVSILALLQENSQHATSIDRAMDKWQDFTRNRLPQVIAQQELALLYAPRAKVSQHLEGLEVASKLSLTADKYLKSKENRRMFVEVRKSLWAIQTLVSASHGWRGAFDTDDVKLALGEVLRGINDMHERDPKGELNPEHKKLAIYIWDWWQNVQPILSNKGNWGVSLRVSKEGPPEDKKDPGTSEATE